MDNTKLAKIYFIEEIVTKAMNGDKRSAIELYMLMPELFIRGTRSNTILDPLIYEANKMR